MAEQSSEQPQASNLLDEGQRSVRLMAGALLGIHREALELNAGYVKLKLSHGAFKGKALTGDFKLARGCLEIRIKVQKKTQQTPRKRRNTATGSRR